MKDSDQVGLKLCGFIVQDEPKAFIIHHPDVPTVHVTVPKESSGAYGAVAIIKLFLRNYAKELRNALERQSQL